MINPDDIQLRLDANGRGAFVIEKDGERLAEMVVSLAGSELTVHHTEVSQKLKGQGIGSLLLEAMVTYARKNNLKVIPLCPFVQAQFKQQREQYVDIWKKNRM